MLSPSPLVSEKTTLCVAVLTISVGIMIFAALPSASLTSASYFLSSKTAASAPAALSAAIPSASA